MAKAGAVKDYAFGQKNHWRRTVANEVLRRTAGREKNEYILYLAGPDDLDRKIFTAKGVPDKNLIAIDKSLPNVSAVKADGHCAVRGDVLDVLWSWPSTRPVCAVLLDYCSGMEKNTAGVYDAFERPVLRSAVIMVNMMRGRDTWSNPIRAAMQSLGLLSKLMTAKRENLDDSEVLVDATKHRAAHFLLFHSWLLAAGVLWPETKNTGRLVGPRRDPLDGLRDSDDAFMFRRVLLGILLGMEPTFYSYKSGVLTFDSAVFRHHSRRLNELSDQEIRDACERMGVEDDRFKVTSKEKEWAIPKLKHRIGAMFAVQARQESV